MLSLFATSPTPPISISISPDYINDGLQAAYVILTLIIVITTIWSIHLSRKQSQEALKITNEQIAKNEQQAKASIEAVYKQIELSKKQAQEAIYNQIRPILVCTSPPHKTLIKMENVGLGVAINVWGVYCIESTDKEPPISSSFEQSMVFLPHKEVEVSLIEDTFIYTNRDAIEEYSFYPQDNYQTRLVVTYSDAFTNRYFSIFDYNEEYGWKQIASQKTERTFDELIMDERVATQQMYEHAYEEHLLDEKAFKEYAEQWDKDVYEEYKSHEKGSENAQQTN